jgi:hypothetical protein
MTSSYSKVYKVDLMIIPCTCTDSTEVNYLKVKLTKRDQIKLNQYLENMKNDFVRYHYSKLFENENGTVKMSVVQNGIQLVFKPNNESLQIEQMNTFLEIENAFAEFARKVTPVVFGKRECFVLMNPAKKQLNLLIQFPKKV